MKSRKGITTDVLAIILLVIALAAFTILWITWGIKGKALGSNLSSIYDKLWNR